MLAPGCPTPEPSHSIAPRARTARALRKGLAGFYVRNRLFVAAVVWAVALIIVVVFNTGAPQ